MRTPKTDPWGVDDGYVDTLGRWRETPAGTRARLHAALGAAPDAPDGPPPAPVLVVRVGEQAALDGPAELVLEDGGVLRVEATLPANLPPGYHELRPLAGPGGPRRLIVGPRHCHLPRGLRTWGWSVQLYALRSAESWGMGDLADLRRLARWAAAEQGAGMLAVNPLLATTPGLPQQPSPYYPSSRCFLNPLYLRIEEVPGGWDGGLEVERLAARGRELSREPRVDRDAVHRLKMGALEQLWSRFGGDPAFDRYCAEQGVLLSRFATFCALAEHHGRRWSSWPEEHRHPDRPGVACFAREQAQRVRFHCWLQWLLDEQRSRASRTLPLMQDLPVGFDPEGADGWAWQDLLAPGFTVGAPPDEFSARGQDWGLPVFVPHKLAAAGYEPFIQTMRSVMRHAGGVRIDHVTGLLRLFCVPVGAGPGEGAYVRYPAEDLLTILALESERAGALVVGEDLGTVEAGARELLTRWRILSYRVLWFEDWPPSCFPELSLAAATTHDLPTIAGVWSGADLRSQRTLGLDANAHGLQQMKEKLQQLTGLTAETAEVGEVVKRTYRLLAAAPSVLATATLEDALSVEERPNIPGTVEEQRPNWSLALPVPLEAIEHDEQVLAIGRAFRMERPGRRG